MNVLDFAALGMRALGNTDGLAAAAACLLMCLSSLLACVLACLLAYKVKLHSIQSNPSHPESAHAGSTRSLVSCVVPALPGRRASGLVEMKVRTVRWEWSS
jgi:uncharacterized membrane protein (DUF4010 family)